MKNVARADGEGDLARGFDSLNKARLSTSISSGLYFRAAALEREGENESAEAAWHPQVGVTLLPSSTFDSFCCNSLRADPAEVASRRLSRALRGEARARWDGSWDLRN